MPGEPGERDTTDDAALGGRLHLLQPRRGHRFGHDAILLAAATPARARDRAADLGAGVGAAGLALAARVKSARVSLVEIDPGLAALAAENISRNRLAGRIDAVALDVAADEAAFAAAGLARASCDAVLMNPPFNDPDRHRASPDPRRRAAHLFPRDVPPRDALARWVGTAARLLRADGTLTVIFRADGLADLLATLDREYGAITLMPVHPKPGAGAIRVIARAVKASRALLAIRPALTLATDRGAPTPEAEVRDGAALEF
jgi:tRNA1(Val) A37 N6-methylase TrmN6